MSTKILCHVAVNRYLSQQNCTICHMYVDVCFVFCCNSVCRLLRCFSLIVNEFPSILVLLNLFITIEQRHTTVVFIQITKYFLLSISFSPPDFCSNYNITICKLLVISKKINTFGKII